MYAIAFELKTDVLKEVYGEPHSIAYSEIQKELETLGFDRKIGNVYTTKEEKNGLAVVYRAVDKLASINWFKESVRDIRAFKIEDWSDFTEIVKG